MAKQGRFETKAPAPAKGKQSRKRNTGSRLLLSLVSSVVSLMLCCTMFLGTTMAWFTDTVTSAGNQITIGTLEVDVLYNDTSLKEKPETKVFESQIRWKPDHFEARELTVENSGDLDIKYVLNLVVEGNDISVAKYFDVYTKAGEVTAEEQESLGGWTRVDNLAEIIKKGVSVTNGELSAAEDKNNPTSNTFGIALHMLPDVEALEGENTIYGKSFTLNIKLDAYQSDAPDGIKDDENTEESIPTSSEPVQINGIYTEEALRAALAAGEDVVLASDIVLTEQIVMNGGTLDGNGHTISYSTLNNGIWTTGGKICNLTIQGDDQASVYGTAIEGDLFSNLEISNVKITGVYSQSISVVKSETAEGTVNVTVEDSVITAGGRVKVDNSRFEQCIFKQNSAGNSGITIETKVDGQETHFVSCEFYDPRMTIISESSDNQTNKHAVYIDGTIYTTDEETGQVTAEKITKDNILKLFESAEYLELAIKHVDLFVGVKQQESSLVMLAIEDISAAADEDSSETDASSESTAASEPEESSQPTDGSEPEESSQPTDGSEPTEGSEPTNGSEPTDGSTPTDGDNTES